MQALCFNKEIKVSLVLMESEPHTWLW